MGGRIGETEGIVSGILTYLRYDIDHNESLKGPAIAHIPAGENHLKAL